MITRDKDTVEVVVVGREEGGREMIAFTDPGDACDFIVGREAVGDIWRFMSISVPVVGSVREACVVMEAHDMIMARIEAADARADKEMV